MESLITFSYKNNGSYDVVIEENFNNLAEKIKKVFEGGKKILIITDSNVAGFYLKDIRLLLEDNDYTTFEKVFEAGENSKQLETVYECYEYLLENDFNRHDIIIGLGGGIAGDMAAYVASTYMRGVNFINIPTTLLAMADSCTGGKCGVNYKKYKNLIGNFYMPSLVYIATDTLKTLPGREYSCGMAEILKAGLIRDGVFYEWLIMNFSEIMDKESELLNEMIYKAISIKQYFVTKDPYETGDRMMLNFGHTLGHALEKYYDFNFSHGECVALGVIAASYISYKRDMLSMEEFYEIRDMFVPFDLPISLDKFDTQKVYEISLHDKKADSSGVKFVLLKKIGKAVVVSDVSKDEIIEALNKLIVEWD